MTEGLCEKESDMEDTETEPYLSHRGIKQNNIESWGEIIIPSYKLKWWRCDILCLWWIHDDSYLERIIAKIP